MGWTYYDRRTSPRDRAAERAEVIRLYTALMPEAPYAAECLMASKVGSTWYLAIRLTPRPGEAIAGPVLSGCVPDENGAITYAGVVLTSRHRGEWGYKDMCESMGPGQAEAPLKLLALLSPLDPEADTYARAWRDGVRAAHEARRGRLRPRPGDRIELERPLRFASNGLSRPFEARRLEAFSHRRSAGARARTLFRTLDTGTPHVVRIDAATLGAAGARLIGPDDDPGDPAPACGAPTRPACGGRP